MRSGDGHFTFVVVENITRRRVIAARVMCANTSAERRRGLLDRREMDSDAGLWIRPCEAVHTFGMHLTLDAVFLDGGLHVKKIVSHLKPNRISFCLAATSVLEVKAGSAHSSGTECGDQLAFHRTAESTAGHNLSR